MRSLYFTLLLASCGLLSFDVDQSLPEQTIQGSLVGGILPSFVPSPFTLSIDFAAETQKRNTGPATSANVKSIQFFATPHDRPSGNFDFLDDVHIFIEADGQPQKEIAFLATVPRGVSTLDLQIVPNVNILPYASAGARITAKATGRQPNKTFTYDGKVTVTIHV